MLAQITGSVYDKEFCGGIVLKDDKVTEAPPLLRFLVGKTRDQVRKVCQDRSWSVRVVSLDPGDQNGSSSRGP